MKPLISNAQLRVIAADLLDKCDLITSTIQRIEVNYSHEMSDFHMCVIRKLNGDIDYAKQVLDEIFEHEREQ